MEVINTNINNEHKSMSSTDMSNGNTSDSSNERKRRNKLTKAQQFKEERQKIVLELENLMGLTENNRGVLLHDLEHNEKLKEYLKEIVPDVKKFYKCGPWNYFVNQHTKEGEELSEICLLRSIFKDEKYEIISRKKIKTIDNCKKHMTNLIFLKI